MSEYFLAIDIGASSGRHIIGWVDHGKMHLQEVHRFENRQVMADGHLCWDMDNLWRGVIEGLKACKEKNMVPVTIGIDTWAVDFVLLDKDDRMIGNPVSYRDGRTTNIDGEVYKIIPEKELYEKTGIQRQPFNTIFQLMALKKESSKDLEEAKSLLMIPDYLNFLLTKVKKQEYTNATSTGLVNAKTNSWDKELIDKLGLPQRLFGELSLPGTVVGKLSEDIAGEVGFSSTVILPATHDTGSAFLSVPARDETSVYLSSGTWSLLGIENASPIISEEARIENLTNEGGAFYRYRFLKNIMGLWIIQSVRRELNGSEYVKGKKSSYATGRNYSFPDLIEEAKKCEGFAGVIDVNDDSFLAPVSMIDAIKDYSKKKELPVPQSVGQIMQCVYKGLALCYRDTVRKLEDITGKRITGINIIGGGCQDEYLNSLTAKALGLPVYAGPIEGTAIGNLVIQMISTGIFEDLSGARDCIYNSFDIKTYR